MLAEAHRHRLTTGSEVLAVPSMNSWVFGVVIYAMVWRTCREQVLPVMQAEAMTAKPRQTANTLNSEPPSPRRGYAIGDIHHGLAMSHGRR